MRCLLLLLSGAANLPVCGQSKGYQKASERRLFEELAIEPEDAASFKPLNATFARDAQRGNFENIETSGSDGAGFEMIGETNLRYARDRLWVYYVHHDIRPDAAPRSVVRQDKGADPRSFAVLDSPTPQADPYDRTGRYMAGKRF